MPVSRKILAFAALGALLVHGPGLAGPVADSGAPTEHRLSVFGAFLAGRHAERHADYGTAADYMRQVLDADPENTDLMERTFLLHASAGDPAVADLAREILARAPEATLPHLVLALDDARAGNLAAAEERLAQLPPETIAGVMLPVLRAWLAYGQDAGERGLTILDEARTADQAGNWSVIYDLHSGLLATLTGDAERAEADLRRAHEAVKNIDTTRALAHFLAAQGRRDEAIALIDETLAEGQDIPLIRMLRERLAAGEPVGPLVATMEEGLAESLFNVATFLGQPQTMGLALVYARLALHTAPESTKARLLVGEILDSLGRPADANAVFAEIPRGTPEYWLAQMTITANLQELDRTDQAISRLRAMAAERGEREDVLQALVAALHDEKRWPEAIETYDRILALQDDPNWRTHYGRGIALERAGRWQEAEKDFLAALEIEPDQPFVLNYLGYTWIDKGVNLERGREMVEKAVELRPNNGFIVDSLGWALYRLGDYKQAVRELERAVELQPDDPTINDHLGDAFWQVGRRQEARFQWLRALSLNPDDELTEAINRKLEAGLPPEAPAPQEAAAPADGEP